MAWMQLAPQPSHEIPDNTGISPNITYNISGGRERFKLESQDFRRVEILFMDEPRKELLDFAGAAKYLGLSVSSIKWSYRMGKLPFVRIGKRLVTTADRLDKAIESQFERAAKR